MKLTTLKNGKTTLTQRISQWWQKPSSHDAGMLADKPQLPGLRDFEGCERPIRVGDVGVLCTREYVGPNGEKPIDAWLWHDQDGFPGNCDSAQKSTTGWRGTTNDWAVYAHGLVRVTDIRHTHEGYAWRVEFTPVTKGR